ncbi:MAG: spore coat protein [Peptococcaceae bacterium]|nr:spore coat protein [Peptococcaceae bacterium]
MQLTQKEQMYLKDAKHHEELCIAKYNHYTQTVSCQQLKQILSWAGQQEANHLNTVSQLLQGQVPEMGGQQGGMSGGQSGQQGSMGQGGSISQVLNQMGSQGSKQQSGSTSGSTQQQGGGGKGQSYSGSMMPSTTASQTQFTGQGMLSDQQICNDLLTTEKAVSDMYDHAVFESTDQQLRQALSHIQKEEQGHAFALFQYMQQKGWYQAQ